MVITPFGGLRSWISVQHKIHHIVCTHGVLTIAPGWYNTFYVRDLESGETKRRVLDTTLTMYRWSRVGGTPGFFLSLTKVLKTPTAAQCTSPDTKLTRECVSSAYFWSSCINQFLSFCTRHAD